MSFDEAKAHEISENGLLIDKGAGVFSGTGSPVGNQAPVGSIYMDKGDNSHWKKYGADASEWRVFSLADIATNHILNECGSPIITDSGEWVMNP